MRRNFSPALDIRFITTRTTRFKTHKSVRTRKSYRARRCCGFKGFIRSQPPTLTPARGFVCKQGRFGPFDKAVAPIAQVQPARVRNTRTLLTCRTASGRFSTLAEERFSDRDPIRSRRWIAADRKYGGILVRRHFRVRVSLFSTLNRLQLLAEEGPHTQA